MSYVQYLPKDTLEVLSIVPCLAGLYLLHLALE
jgi:hypothetical protein